MWITCEYEDYSFLQSLHNAKKLKNDSEFYVLPLSESDENSSSATIFLNADKAFDTETVIKAATMRSIIAAVMYMFFILSHN